MSNILSAKPDNAQFIDGVVLNQDMVDGADDMAGLLSAPQPPFVFAPSGITFGRQPKPVKLFKGLSTARCSNGITLTSAAQGQADADRRDSIRRGGR